ncbi:unnamed protein product [Medioppia subpectinata]|uniref:Nose resistant-to-fluoxetine protein N-terminal domain-containing protein n=1 Tax=Medioppia subpectinata TaxID=1979941 RepID=A0A7R9KH86_9ACAR|nr:unnamed protein product [Medioppia subpectinata]CAG2102301.1 unnamed protein product [Medioppia subpectinata]
MTNIPYISSDFQLYLLAPIVFLVLYRWPRIGLVWNIVVILIGICIPLAQRLLFGVKHYFEFSFDTLWSTQNSIILYYWRSDSHIVSYAIGILCGYLIRAKPNLYLGGRVGETFLWISCTTITLLSMYWNNYFFDPYYPLSLTEMLLFMAFSKPLYLLGWVWMFYACATGRGAIGWKGFIPTSRLSFELHTMVIFYRAGTLRENVDYTLYYVTTVAIFQCDNNDVNSVDLPEKCSLNRLMSNMFESLTPEDWEQEKNRSVIYQRVDHINQTVDKLNRLKNITDKIKQTYEPIVQRLGSLMDTLMIPESGIISHKKPHIGYDECLQLQSPNAPNIKEFSGQYCWLGAPNIALNERTFDELGTLVNWTELNEQIKNNSASYMRTQDNKTERFKPLKVTSTFANTFTTDMPMGLCLPTTCRPQDIEFALNKR